MKIKLCLEDSARKGHLGDRKIMAEAYVDYYSFLKSMNGLDLNKKQENMLTELISEWIRLGKTTKEINELQEKVYRVNY